MMKKLALSLCLVFAFSSVASAINFGSVSMEIRGYNKWVDGKFLTQEHADSRTMKLSVSGKGWKAMAEYSGAATLDDYYFKTENEPFTLEVWGRGEDQNNDYKTPFGWINETDDAPSTWEARLTSKLFDGEAVFAIENDTSKPFYYGFYKKAVGTTTLGTAYRTQFSPVDKANVFDVYAIADLEGVNVTGEVALETKRVAGKDESKAKIGLKGEFDFGLTLNGWTDRVSDTNYVEAIQLTTDKLYRLLVSYKDEKAAQKKSYDVYALARASNDQTITDIFNVHDTWYNIYDIGDNDWLKNKGWAAGARLQSVNDEKADVVTNTITLNGQYQFNANTNALATLVLKKVGDADLTKDLQVRGYYKASAKAALHPRFFVNESRVWTGSYADYTINKGHLLAGAFVEKNLKDKDADLAESFEVGYQIAF